MSQRVAKQGLQAHRRCLKLLLERKDHALDYAPVISIAGRTFEQLPSGPDFLLRAQPINISGVIGAWRSRFPVA
jgi:hypothetical protein